MGKVIVLSAGHSNMSGRDQGATGNGYIEGHLAVELRQLVSTALKKMGINPIMDGNNSILKESLNYFRKVINSENTIALELHWNSASSTATGSEVLVPAAPSKEEKQLASDLSKITSSLLRITDRGVKTELQSHHGKLGWMTLQGTNILMEVCFISNASDMENYQEAKFKLAESIATILFNYSSGMVKNTGITTVNDFKIHEVKSGETLSTIAGIYGISLNQILHDNNIELSNANLIHVGQQIKIYNKK